MMVYADKVNLRETHISCDLCSGVHAGAGIVDAMCDIITEAKVPRILRLLIDDIEVLGTIDADAMPPVQLNWNKFCR